MTDDNLKVVLGYLPDNCAEEHAVELSELTATYMQLPDTNSDRDDYQYLTITTQNNGSGEDGIYYNVKISGQWSISKPSDLSAIVEDFESRLNHKITKVDDLKTY